MKEHATSVVGLSVAEKACNYKFDRRWWQIDTLLGSHFLYMLHHVLLHKISCKDSDCKWWDGILHPVTLQTHIVIYSIATIVTYILYIHAFKNKYPHIDYKAFCHNDWKIDSEGAESERVDNVQRQLNIGPTVNLKLYIFLNAEVIQKQLKKKNLVVIYKRINSEVAINMLWTNTHWIVT